jgi:hypothetical protein
VEAKSWTYYSGTDLAYDMDQVIRFQYGALHWQLLAHKKIAPEEATHVKPYCEKL